MNPRGCLSAASSLAFGRPSLGFALPVPARPDGFRLFGVAGGIRRSLCRGMGEDRGAVVAVAAGSESRKRARGDGESGRLERVAEIVMVLSAMGQMRGGRDPTAAEKALMWEAREKLTKFCESVELSRRKDLFTKEMAMAVVVDHGLNPPKENVPRPPKLSIAEKVANTKKKVRTRSFVLYFFYLFFQF